MSLQFEPTRETEEEERNGPKQQTNIFFVAETYSIQRRSKADLAVTKRPQKQEATWLPKRVVQFTLRSGFSSITLLGGFLLASLVIYGTFIFATIGMWEWLSVNALSGVAALAMIFGAQAIIGILFSVIEENDPVRLVGRFTQYVGSLVLYSGTFLISGWLCTQWLRSELIPLTGKPTATAISILALWFVVKLILDGVVRSYRAVAR